MKNKVRFFTLVIGLFLMPTIGRAHESVQIDRERGNEGLEEYFKNFEDLSKNGEWNSLLSKGMGALNITLRAPLKAID